MNVTFNASKMLVNLNDNYNLTGGVLSELPQCEITFTTVSMDLWMLGIICVLVGAIIFQDHINKYIRKLLSNLREK